MEHVVAYCKAANKENKNTNHNSPGSKSVPPEYEVQAVTIRT
jgi:hypothetical protein